MLKCPQVDFQEVLSFVGELDSKYQTKQFSANDICSVMGIRSDDNHRFRGLVMGSKLFGLMASKKGPTFQLTSLTKKIIYPIDPNNRSDKIEAFSKPEVYKELIERFNEAGYPTTDTLANILINDYDVSSTKSQMIAGNFLKGVSELKIDSSNIQIEEPDAIDSEKADTDTTLDRQIDLFNDGIVSEDNQIKPVVSREKKTNLEPIEKNPDNQGFECSLSVGNDNVVLRIPANLLGRKDQLIRTRKFLDGQIESLIALSDEE